MELEQQVCSLELAKKLKELGIKQKSYFYWKTDLTTEKSQHYMKPYLSEEPDEYAKLKKIGSIPDLVYQHYVELYSAFTVAELGEMLPNSFTFEDVGFWLKQIRGKHFFQISYEGETLLNRLSANTEADARAKMLIYLLENSLTNLSL